MFTTNTSHRQQDLFDDMLMSLPEAKRQKAMKSKKYAFYKEVFCRIDESVFAPLFPSERGRPNAPVNAMVGALILRECRSWTFDELFCRLDFDVLTRLALGLTNMSDTPFCPATLFNFQQRLIEYEREHGVNLLEVTFQQLTAGQIQRFGVGTDIQRCDSFRAMSNIASFGRVRLLVEVLLRLHRILRSDDRERFAEILGDYVSQSSDNYVHALKDSELPRELKKLGGIYARLHAELADRYSTEPAFAIFERLLAEQFELHKSGKVRVRKREEIHSGTLQSPDDPDATYNAKSGKPQKGHKVNVVETASPDNEVNLITDVAVAPNNVHDGAMLSERMDGLKERTPDLAEMHTDGGYGGAALDPKMGTHKVLHVETGTKMGHARVNMRYEPSGADGWTVSCPCQTVLAERTKKRWKAVFAVSACQGCHMADRCTAKQYGDNRMYYFEESWAKSFMRSQNIKQIPENRRKLRANVEATMKEFTGCFNHKGKLRVRGLARTTLQMLAAAIAINFGRIFRHQTGKLRDSAGEAASAIAFSRIARVICNCICGLMNQIRSPVSFFHFTQCSSKYPPDEVQSDLSRAVLKKALI